MATIRELRDRIRSIGSTKKITKAQELIATSRITKAQARVAASRPYAEEITKVVTALASASGSIDSPLVAERANPRRVAVLVVTSDSGQCGAYNANVLRETEELLTLLRSEGKEPELYVLGRKGVTYYTFRDRPIAASWTGFSQQPHYGDVQDAVEHLVEGFLAGSDEQVSHPLGDGSVDGYDEIHIVYTRFISMLSQVPVVRRMAPIDVAYEVEHLNLDGDLFTEHEVSPEIEFEPEAGTLLAALLPKYVASRIFAALLESAASENAARRTAMQAATDNATELEKALSREANQLRQAQITQEISEIVGGADALAH